MEELISTTYKFIITQSLNKPQPENTISKIHASKLSIWAFCRID